MVQEFHVVRCYSCQSFQSQQVCKKPKFCCKMCGEKQSVRKEYGRGSGKDCRIHVQKLNSLQGNREAEEEQRLEAKLEEQEESENFVCGGYPNYLYEVEDLGNQTESYIHEGNMAESVCSSKSSSKWSTYLTDEDDVDDHEDKTSSISSSRQRHSQREDSDEGKGNPFTTFGIDSDCCAIQANSTERMTVMGKKVTQFFKPPMKDGQSPVGNETVSVKQNEPGPVRVRKTHFQEPSMKGKSRLCSSPYPSVSSSELSQVYKSQNNFDENVAAGSTSLHTGNLIRHSANTTGRLGKSDLMNDRPGSVMPLRKKLDNIVHSNNRTNTSDKRIKRNPEGRDEVGVWKSELEIEKFNQPHQVDPKSLRLRKQRDFVTCIKNSASAAFRKYELADDVEDIDFDL